MSNLQYNNFLTFDEAVIIKVNEESYIILTVLDIFDMEGRQACKWVIYDKGQVAAGTAGHDENVCSGDYIWSGARGIGATPLDYAHSMLSYLGAFAESSEYSENSDLFFEELRTWANQNSDEFSMLSMELEDDEGDE